MEWSIELHNRLSIGIAIGFAYHPIDEDYDNGEFILYLGIISINYKWRYDEDEV